MLAPSEVGYLPYQTSMAAGDVNLGEAFAEYQEQHRRCEQGDDSGDQQGVHFGKVLPAQAKDVPHP